MNHIAPIIYEDYATSSSSSSRTFEVSVFEEVTKASVELVGATS